jgi:ABC-type cobalamin/Fe3+-siderophores transport system ATPase subunit
MHLDRVYIDGFKNLRDFEIDFAKERLTAVIIGQNGAGKSNLIEAIATIFRDVDLNRKTRFTYDVHYHLDTRAIRITNRDGRALIEADGKTVARKSFDTDKDDYFPALVFGYYSGSSSRLERVFEEHQRRYYSAIIEEGSPSLYERAARDRRLFYSRTIHGSFVLFVLQAFINSEIPEFLQRRLQIKGFDSALAVLKEPSWHKGKSLGRGRRSHAAIEAQAQELWGASGLAGDCVRALRDSAFLPFPLKGNPQEDYRQARREEGQFACYLRDTIALRRFASRYSSEQSLFYALEAADISDLFRELNVWVTRAGGGEEIEFGALSDGERQLLMVLGLIRISRGKNTLFLLDEPDTHLNPIWQHTYLELIREWSGVASDASDFHIIMTSHNPLTIAGLSKEEVHVMYHDNETGRTEVDQPNVDPKGLGVAGVLRQVFGMRTTLDPETQRLVDKRNRLLAQQMRDGAQEEKLQEMNEQIRALGISMQNQQDLFEQFLRGLDAKYLEDRTLSPRDIAEQNEAIMAAIARIKSTKTTVQ